MIEQRGDVHHVFPKEYLKQGGLGKGQYNQVANYAYVQSEINIRLERKRRMTILAMSLMFNAKEDSASTEELRYCRFQKEFRGKLYSF